VRQIGSVLGVAFVFAAVELSQRDPLAPYHAIWLLLAVAGLAVAWIGWHARTGHARR
jgi:hypothetical protein